MKTTTRYALACALLMSSSVSILATENATEFIDCSKSTTELVALLEKSPEKVLEIVANAVASNESCAGEIVKAAIEYTNADIKLVEQIVETAMATAPKQIGEIAVFAMATAPDANKVIIASIEQFNADNGTGQGFGFDPSLVDPKGSDLTLIDPKAGIDGPVQPTGINPLDFPGGQTQLFVDPKAGGAAPGVGAPGLPVADIPENTVNPPVVPPVSPPLTPPVDPPNGTPRTSSL